MKKYERKWKQICLKRSAMTNRTNQLQSLHKEPKLEQEREKPAANA
ncbi:MAG: hypothetical protein ACE3JP_02515 [Ectobacillus sp.]